MSSFELSLVLSTNEKRMQNRIECEEKVFEIRYAMYLFSAKLKGPIFKDSVANKCKRTRVARPIDSTSEEKINDLNNVRVQNSRTCFNENFLGS